MEAPTVKFTASRNGGLQGIPAGGAAAGGLGRPETALPVPGSWCSCGVGCVAAEDIPGAAAVESGGDRGFAAAGRGVGRSAGADVGALGAAEGKQGAAGPAALLG